MSRLIEISAAQLEQLTARVNRTSRSSLRPLLDAIGAQQESAARKRITDTKRSPEGTNWQDWSRDYAKTREPQHSLLQEGGDLADSMTHQAVAPDAVEVGSPMEYAAAHLFGYEDIPARPYLDTEGGFADRDDRDELQDILEDFLTEAFAA